AGGLILLAFFGLGEAAILRTHLGRDWPTVTATTPADPADVAAIQALLNRAYDLGGVLNGPADYAQLSMVYTDDPNVPLTTEQLESLEQVRIDRGTAVPALQPDGYLAYLMAVRLRQDAPPPPGVSPTPKPSYVIPARPNTAWS